MENNMPLVKYKILKNYCGEPLKVAKDGDAGIDLRYGGEDKIYINDNTVYQIPTGVKLAIPKGYCGIVLERSGLSVKYGIEILARVIDSSYRGEIFIVLSKTSKERCQVTSSAALDRFHEINRCVINPGDRIAQIVFLPFNANMIEVSNDEELGETERGESGFGSTGL